MSSTVSCSPDSLLLLLYWLSGRSFQPVSLTSLLAESIWEHLVLHSHPAALGYWDPRFHCLAVCRIHCLPASSLSCHLDCPSPQFCQANFWCPECFQLPYPHRIQLDDGQFFAFGGHFILDFFLQGGLLQKQLVAQVIFPTMKCSHTIMLNVWLRCFEHVFSMWNLSNSCHLSVLSARFLLCSS